MDFFVGLIIIVAICIAAVLVLPQPPYGGRPKGCMGGGLQRAMEEEKERKAKKKAAE